MIRRLLMLCIVMALATAAMAQATLSGTVKDKTDGNKPLFEASVVLKKNGVFVTGAKTDFDGNYRITGLDGGLYDVEVSYVGLLSQKTSGVLIKAGQLLELDFELGANDMLRVIEVIEYKVPLIDLEQNSGGKTVTGAEIMRMPTKSVNGIAATVAGASSSDGGDVTIKGSRSNATNYYIDGIRVSGNSIPQSEIDQLQVITGGIESRYGDVTGGIISITTRGPADKFSGGFEVESSNYLDAFGYTLGSANLSGPIIKRKRDSVTVLGYRVSAQYVDQLDDDPPATTVYRVKDDVLAQLEANPIVNYGQSRISAAELLTTNDMQRLKYNPYENRKALDLTAKLEARVSDAVQIAFFGSTNDVNNRFTPNSGDPSTPWTTYNSHNNPTNDASRYRGNFRLKHDLSRRQAAASATTDGTAPAPSKGLVVSGAKYTLQAGYEVYTENRQDPRHRDRLFDYGYIGNYDFSWTPIFQNSVATDPSSPLRHVDFRQDFFGFQAGSQNEVLANYNNVSDASNVNTLILRNGVSNNAYDNAWGLHTNVGQVYNRFSRQNDEVITGLANFQFDLLPKGNKEKAHNIEFGLWYEQRVNRNYAVSPYGLWNVASQSANRHILGVDTLSGEFYPTYASTGGYAIQPNGDSIFVYNTQITSDPEVVGDLYFYKAIRELTGQSLHEYVNVDGIDPNDMRLDMFSAAELNEQNLLDYYGYDYLGNKLGNDVTFDDFFTTRDAQTGVRTFPVAAVQPVYQAGYVQDKFKIGSMIVRLGLRVDRYDANQKVLKDPYALYDIMDAQDFYNKIGQERPSNIGSDYKVYVTGENSQTVRAYRSGDQWYTPSGTAVDSRLIFGQGGLVYPFYKREGTTPNRIRDLDFDPNESFQDYTPQVNLMPRLAFSFPISDVANFFAHYDVLVQRPPSNTVVTALDFYYWNTPGRFGTDNIRNNANLLPERTVDYEVGYQQKLNQYSAIKVAAFYKEMRNMIQLRTLVNLPAPISSYTTFDNIDFGTVKGMTFQYDLRPQNNLSMAVNYTLQFADATGSDAESQKGLTNNGSNIRNLFPLNFDERHRLAITGDYRFGEKAKYNGPKWFGTEVFANAGANFQLFAVSGRPYTAKIQPDQFGGIGTLGSINGARLPWTFQMDARIDKDFKVGKKVLNVYLRSQNLFNRRNVNSVYPVTGSATDDGYLVSPRGQQRVNNINSSGLNLMSFLDSYQWRLLNPDNFSLPRRIFIGAIFNF